MAHQQEYIIARGIPGSGKSTWAQKWAEEDPLNRVRVNRDDIRQQLIKAEGVKPHQRTDGYYVYDKKTGRLDKDFEGRITNLENSITKRALDAGKSVVSDNTNLGGKVGKLGMQIARQRNFPVVVKEFPVDIEEAIRRDKLRDRSVGEKVIKSMYDRLGPNGAFHHVDGTFPLQKFNRPEKRGQHAVGFDLDGTLADVRSIRHFVIKDEKGRRNFDMFHRSSLFVPPHPEVVQMMKDAKAAGYAVLITTARGAEYAEVSQRWLKENGLEFDNYYCRPKGDFRSDYEVKKDLYDIISRDYDLIHQVDDNPAAIKAWEEKGVMVTKVPFGDDLPEGETVKINNLFRTGGCLRCGKPLSKGTIGPRCATKS